HELRTPLNTVIGYSELLKEDAVEDDNASLGKDLDKINHAAHHLLNLINGVLDLSKIEAGRMDVHVEEIDIKVLVQQIRELIIPQIEKNNNRLSINVEDGCDHIQTDYTKLKQILLNLLSNAAKFTHAGEVTLRIRQLNVSKDAVIEIVVTDTGIGIDEDGLERLFEPFTQADTSTTRKYGGTGLGLTITKRFSEMLHGNLSVDSEMGRGTSFQLILPKEYASTADYKKHIKQAIQKRFGENENPGGIRKKISTVLVIEDDPDMRDILMRNLTTAGFHVEMASNGLDGLKRARELQPDVITLDVMMPGMDGWSVLKTLKLDPDLKFIPVIMISMTNQLNISKIMGANDYLQKPVDFEKLHNMLRKWLRSDGRTDILIVDDDLDTRAAMRSIIEQKGAQVREAANGKQALEIMKSFSPDVLIVDLLMPGVDSFELLETVHGLPNADAISIIVTTAKDLTRQDKQRLEKMGVYIVQKNQLSSNDLLKKIKDAVGPIT
ncbi:MAG: response regulator, partial [Gammaproteobacteria bacterium]|nr:response regulator [Gammaproteobacteria bacterium]